MFKKREKNYDEKKADVITWLKRKHMTLDDLVLNTKGCLIHVYNYFELGAFCPVNDFRTDNIDDLITCFHQAVNYLKYSGTNCSIMCEYPLRIAKKIQKLDSLYDYSDLIDMGYAWKNWEISQSLESGSYLL